MDERTSWGHRCLDAVSGCHIRRESNQYITNCMLVQTRSDTEGEATKGSLQHTYSLTADISKLTSNTSRTRTVATESSELSCGVRSSVQAAVRVLHIVHPGGRPGAAGLDWRRTRGFLEGRSAQGETTLKGWGSPRSVALEVTQGKAPMPCAPSACRRLSSVAQAGRSAVAAARRR